MDPGVIGVIGVPAVSPVVRVESRSAHEPVPILPQPTVDWTAMDLGKKRVNATLELAQWTEGGANGRNGARARDLVAGEYKREHEHVTVHDQLTEASSVLDQAARHVFVVLMIAQSMETGAGGNHGDRAQNLVVADHRPVRARALILLRPMVGRNAEE